MKGHFLISILFLATLAHGQDWRLDSVASDDGQNQCRTKYLYTSPRDFIIHQEKFKDHKLDEISVSVYQDSLQVKCDFTVLPSSFFKTWYKYDARRRVIATTTQSWLPGVLHKYYTYWRDTDLKTSEITLEITGNDTSLFRSKENLYDNDNRFIGGTSKEYQSGFLQRTDECTMTYEGDSVKVTTRYSFDPKSGYDTVTTKVVIREIWLHQTGPAQYLIEKGPAGSNRVLFIEE